MLKADIDPAKAAAQYLDDTNAFDPNQITAFVITAQGLPSSVPNRDGLSIKVQSSDAVFAKLQTAFANFIANKRAAAQTLLTNLGIT